MESPPPRKRKRAVKCLSVDSQVVIPPDVRASWPPGKLPVEIFSIITSFLARSNVQNMRFVNHEFEEKVSGGLFNTVVVPFRPELYGGSMRNIPKKIDKYGALQGHSAVLLQDKGMRVFQGFGGYIRRFAMSFELDYIELNSPPSKSDQEAVTTFWGIYRWPFKKYNRFAQLRGLEHTADETMTMTKALRYLDSTQELALSLDGGLGWLNGPDVNPQAHYADQKVSVFGKTRFPAEEDMKQTVRARQNKCYQTNSYLVGLCSDANKFLGPALGADGNQPTAVEQMLLEAGYEGDSLFQSLRMLMESEGQQISATHSSPDMSSSAQSEEIVGVHRRQRGLYGTTTPIRKTIEIDGPSQERVAVSVNIDDDTNINCSMESTSIFPLIPNSLTTSQKEMILETEWAQRAFIQSWSIAIIDNPVTFKYVTTLTIARLPNRHLSILRRDDFWTGLTQLESVSLAVIPGWRDVTKNATGYVEDIPVTPSQSIRGVYILLKDYVGKRKSIKAVHFEWLCGGEDAPGIFSRNQHILAAPLLPEPTDIVSRSPKIIAAELLNLPYVKHLSIKNCWISPHILSRFTKSLKNGSLESLKLDSVSLCAPIARNMDPTPLNPDDPQNDPPHWAVLQNGAVPHGLAQIIQGNTINQGPIAAPPSSDSWLDVPRIGSWAQYIDWVTPGPNLSTMRYERDIGPKPVIHDTSSQLKNLSFSSCGYVRLSLDFDQEMLDPHELLRRETSTTVKRRIELERMMMKSGDPWLGTIINYIDETEARTLQNAWNLNIGWNRARRAMASQAIADGIRFPGLGRFRGNILASVLVFAQA